MKRQIVNSVPSLTTNERRTNRPAPTPGKLGPEGANFDICGSSSTQTSTPASQGIDDGFKVVSHRKKERNPKPKPIATPISSAAARRARVYEKPSPDKPYYKQSCLPAKERDAALMEAERCKGIKLPQESFTPGMIIRAVLHEADFQRTTGASNVTDGDKFRTNSIYGPIYSKARRMVVLATFKDNYIAIPLYTHNGRGLEGKLNPEEFVSVQDHRSPGSFTPLSKHRPLHTEHLNLGTDLFHVKTTVHITYPVSRKYSLPVVHEGRLTDMSVNALAGLFSDCLSPFVKFGQRV